jgi:hypothetical protein
MCVVIALRQHQCDVIETHYFSNAGRDRPQDFAEFQTGNNTVVQVKDEL